MKYTYGVALLLCSVAAHGLIAQEGKDKELAPKWTLLNLRIGIHDAKLGGGEDGTCVRTRLHLLDTYLVAIDFKASKLDSFVDDKGTDLLKASGAAFQVAQPPLAPSGPDYMDVEFRGVGRPIQGASKLRLKGTVVAIVAKTEKEVTLADLKVGTIKNGKAFGGTIPLLYEGSRPLKKAEMVTPDGKGLPFRISQRLGSKKNDDNSLWFSANLTAGFGNRNKEIKHDSIRVTYFETVERINVPVDLEFGSGL